MALCFTLFTILQTIITIINHNKQTQYSTIDQQEERITPARPHDEMQCSILVPSSSNCTTQWTLQSTRVGWPVYAGGQREGGWVGVGGGQMTTSSTAAAGGRRVSLWLYPLLSLWHIILSQEISDEVAVRCVACWAGAPQNVWSVTVVFSKITWNSLSNVRFQNRAWTRGSRGWTQLYSRTLKGHIKHPQTVSFFLVQVQLKS